MTSLPAFVNHLSDRGYKLLLQAANALGFVLGAALALLIIYTYDTKLNPVITNYRVSHAELHGDLLVISGEMTLARPCKMEYIAFYGEDKEGNSRSLAHYEREAVMKLTRTIDHGQGQVPFGPITVPVPHAGEYEWLTIVSSHQCVAPWPNPSTLTHLYVPAIKGER